MRNKLTALVVVFLVAAVAVTAALATPSTVIATLLARGTFTKPINASADGITLRANHSTDHAVQTITSPPGATSGWHAHPGIALITVKSGTVALYDSNCVRETFSAGQSFLEACSDAVLVRNETAHDAVLYVTFIVPADVPLRIDKPNPGYAVE
jgi:hypothetical protein